MVQSRIRLDPSNAATSGTIDNLKVKQTISTSDWAPGIYIVRVSNQEGIETLKLLVE